MARASNKGNIYVKFGDLMMSTMSILALESCNFLRVSVSVHDNILIFKPG